MGARNDPYRRIAPIYDRLLEPLNAGLRRIVIATVDPQPGWRVLDVGCGTGTGLVPYRAAGCEVSGVDVSPAMLRLARDRLGSGVDLALTDGNSLPFPDDHFDLVATTLVLHEVPVGKRNQFLTEMARVLAPDGRLVVVDFRFGSKRGWKGPLLSWFIGTIERFSGHYDGYRSLKRGGGVRPLLEASDLVMAEEKIVAGGNLAIYVAA